MRKAVIALSIFSIFSCTNNVVFKADKEIESAWNMDSLATFYYQISDTISTYCSRLNIRHSSAYSYQNLYVFIHTTNPLGIRISDTINCMFADKTGKWNGNGIGDVLNFSTSINDSIIHESSGEYKIEIEQAMRYGKTPKIELLSEILSVGICIKKR